MFSLLRLVSHMDMASPDRENIKFLEESELSRHELHCSLMNEAFTFDNRKKKNVFITESVIFN